jgi:hypothetical protein
VQVVSKRERRDGFELMNKKMKKKERKKYLFDLLV